MFNNRCFAGSSYVDQMFLKFLSNQIDVNIWKIVLENHPNVVANILTTWETIKISLENDAQDLENDEFGCIELPLDIQNLLNDVNFFECNGKG